jgi:alkylation response protein AidB-like acyl-CoA dehydrogenase
MTTTTSQDGPGSPAPDESSARSAGARLRAGGPAEILAAADRVADFLAEGADHHDREGSYAPENIAAIWAAGLGNLTLPAELGGVGVDLTTAARVVERLAQGDPATALIYVMHLSHLRTLVDDPGGIWPVALRDRIVADSLAGPALINALRVEPELGTPARGGVPATRARRAVNADGQPTWRLNGRKIYSTGSYGLAWMNVWGATESDDPDGQRTGFFVVPADTPGVEIVDTWDHLGMRASVSHDVVFHDVEIPSDYAVGLQAPDQGMDPAAARNQGWVSALLISIYTGVLKSGRDWLAGYLNDRVPTNLGASLATLPRFQAAVGEIEVLAYTNERLLFGFTADIDAGGERAAAAGPGISIIKVVVTNNVIRGLESALGLIGNPGLSYHHPLQRHYRNALCSRIHTPQDDVVLTATGRAVLTH